MFMIIYIHKMHNASEFTVKQDLCYCNYKCFI